MPRVHISVSENRSSGTMFTSTRSSRIARVAAYVAGAGVCKRADDLVAYRVQQTQSDVVPTERSALSFAAARPSVRSASHVCGPGGPMVLLNPKRHSREYPDARS